jgi:hypothetical protein
MLLYPVLAVHSATAPLVSPLLETTFTSSNQVSYNSSQNKTIALSAHALSIHDNVFYVRLKGPASAWNSLTSSTSFATLSKYTIPFIRLLCSQETV